MGSSEKIIKEDFMSCKDCPEKKNIIYPKNSSELNSLIEFLIGNKISKDFFKQRLLNMIEELIVVVCSDNCKCPLKIALKKGKL